MKNRSLKQYFVTGLLVWLPMGITVWVIMWLVGVLDAIFRAVLHAADTLIPGIHANAEYLRGVPGLGVAIVAVFILATGVFVANMFGQWWLRKWHGMMNRIPVVRSIYTSVKQVADTLFSGSGLAFSKALLVQYPHAGSWTIAFQTGVPGGDVKNHLQGDYVSVYVPTTPNPTSGFFLMYRREDTIELEMSVDEALKYIVSMGVVAPPPSKRAPAASLDAASH